MDSIDLILNLAFDPVKAPLHLKSYIDDHFDELAKQKNASETKKFRQDVLVMLNAIQDRLLQDRTRGDEKPDGPPLSKSNMGSAVITDSVEYLKLSGPALLNTLRVRDFLLPYLTICRLPIEFRKEIDLGIDKLPPIAIIRQCDTIEVDLVEAAGIWSIGRQKEQQKQVKSKFPARGPNSNCEVRITVPKSGRQISLRIACKSRVRTVLTPPVFIDKVPMLHIAALNDTGDLFQEYVLVTPDSEEMVT